VTIRDEDGRELARLEASPERFERHVVALPLGKGDMEIVFDTDTFVPGADDDRALGVAVSKVRISGQRSSPREWVGEKLPRLLRNPQDLSFLDHYQPVLANSEYTRGWIKRYWGEWTRTYCSLRSAWTSCGRAARSAGSSAWAASSPAAWATPRSS